MISSTEPFGDDVVEFAFALEACDAMGKLLFIMGDSEWCGLIWRDVVRCWTRGLLIFPSYFGTELVGGRGMRTGEEEEADVVIMFSCWSDR